MTADRALAELSRREPLFHPPPATREAFDALVVDDFWEVGATGNIYDKDTIWSVVARRRDRPEPAPLSTDDHAVRQLAPDTWLHTFRLWQGERQTRRATVWWHREGVWVAVYHQGTEVGDLPAELVAVRGGDPTTRE